MRPVIALMLLAGCGPGWRVDDSFSSSIDLPVLGDYGDNRINSPYLRGAAFQLSIIGDADRIGDLTLTSDDEAVLTVGPTQFDPEDRGRRFAEVSAVGLGSTSVHVLEGDRERAEFEVRVADPDRLTLHPVARLVQEDESEDDVPTVVVGGRAEVEVHPYDGSDLLVGSAWQVPASPAGLTVEASGYHASGLHDVVALSPTEAGSWTLAMPYGSGNIDFAVDAIAPEAVTALDVECQTDEELNAGDSLYCLSTATAADGADVYGVAPAWEVGGVLMTGTGDLLVVTYDGVEEPAIATYGGLVASLSVPGTGSSVGSTNDVTACSSAGGVPTWAFLPLGLLLLNRRGRPGTR